MNFRVIFDAGEWNATVEKAASRTIRTFVADTISRMLISFALPKSGRFYKVSRTGRPHQASAPGEAPAVDTGFLANRLQIKAITKEFPDPLTGIISVGAEYAEYLERGTSRMRPRPFVQPAIEGALDAINSGGIVGRLA